MDAELDAIWKALADPTRRSVLDRLRSGPRTTGDLAGAFPDLTRYAVMKHLRVLESVGLVVARKEGRRRWNTLNAVPLRRVYERWVSKYEDRWAGSLLRLKRATERRERAMGTQVLDKAARIAVVQTQIEIAAPRGAVYRAFIERPGDWFYESEETRRSSPTRLEPRVGGRFSMVHENGDENLIATVTMLKRDRKIRLRGDCTIPQAFIANMTVSFEDAGAGTRVSVDHRMCGEFDDDLPEGFREGWGDGLGKLKALVEGV